MVLSPIFLYFNYSGVSLSPQMVHFLNFTLLFPSCCVWWGEKRVETGDNINNRNIEIMGPNKGGELSWKNEISLKWW